MGSNISQGGPFLLQPCCPGGFLGGFNCLVHQAAGEGISVATLFPPSICEHDLLELAARQHWDLAFLILNNIYYDERASGKRTTSTVIRNAGNLIKKMKQFFGRPIISFFGWSDDPAALRRTVTLSGGDCLFRLPYKFEEVIPVLKYHLDRMPGL